MQCFLDSFWNVFGSLAKFVWIHILKPARSSKALWMSSSSSTFGRGLLTLCGSTLGLFIRRFDSRISTSTTRFCSGGQRESVLSMPSSRTTMPFSPQLQDVQIRMRRWLCWCDVHGLRFQFLCCWKGLQGVSRL